MEVLTSFEFNGVKAVVALRAALLIKSTFSEACIAPDPLDLNFLYVPCLTDVETKDP